MNGCEKGGGLSLSRRGWKGAGGENDYEWKWQKRKIILGIYIRVGVVSKKNLRGKENEQGGKGGEEGQSRSKIHRGHWYQLIGLNLSHCLLFPACSGTITSNTPGIKFWFVSFGEKIRQLGITTFWSTKNVIWVIMYEIK